MIIGQVTVPEDCFISPGAVLDGSDGEITLGSGVYIGPNVIVMGGARIGDGAYIGAGSVIYLGAKVGASALIEPGCVIKADVKAYERMSCAPAVSDGPASLELQRLISDLYDYMKSRNRSYQPRKWEIAKGVLKYINCMGLDEWCQLYEMTIGLLWQQQTNFREDQLEIRKDFIDPAIRHFQPKPTTNCQTHRGQIAWLIKHAALGTYAPFKHVIAYLSGFPPCQVYVHGSMRTKEVAQLEGYGHTVRQFKGTPTEQIDAIRAQCEKDGIQVLISDIYTAIPTALYQLRSAPIQAYLSPGMQLLPCDLVLYPETQDPIDYPGHVKEEIPTAVLPEHLAGPAMAKRPRKFGVLTRAEKASRQYWETVIEIAEATDSELLFYGRGEPEISHPRILPMGIANAEDAFKTFSVYLDTFPTCGGLSCYEAMAHGIPVVSLEIEAMRCLNRFKPDVVADTGLYKTEAVRLINGKGYRDIAVKGEAIIAQSFVNIDDAVGKMLTVLTQHGWQA